jgi:hypothetical protein
MEATVNEFVVSGLVKRRAELAGDIENTQQRLATLVHDLEALDAVILQFEPGYELATIKAKAFRPPADWSKRGEMGRVIMGILRQAAEPLSTRDITVQLFVQRALNQNDHGLFRLMCKRVGVSLRDYRNKGTVRFVDGPGMYNLWEVVR